MKKLKNQMKNMTQLQKQQATPFGTGKYQKIISLGTKELKAFTAITKIKQETVRNGGLTIYIQKTV